MEGRKTQVQLSYKLLCGELTSQGGFRPCQMQELIS